MASFVFTYRAPKQYAPGAPQAVAEWKAFFDAMGEHLVNMGNPVFERSVSRATPSSAATRSSMPTTSTPRSQSRRAAPSCHEVAESRWVSWRTST